MEDGLYETVINESIEEELDSLDPKKGVKRENIDKSETSSYDILSTYIHDVVKSSLKTIHENSKMTVNDEIEVCNEILDKLSAITNDEDVLNKKISKNDDNLLLSITKSKDHKITRPITSVTISSLFTGRSSKIPLYEELKREISTADEVLFLVSFIKMSGINQIFESLKNFTENNGKLRILTTTYMGVTERFAVDRLAKLKNTEIKISYDSRSTRLHAKAYVFKRNSGFDTAFIGSSNLSKAAMNEGMEWNVKLTAQDVPDAMKNIFHLYDQYWNSSDFKKYDFEKDGEALDLALNTTNAGNNDSVITLFELKPFAFQNQILEQLQAERKIHNQYRNLVIAATGTGKTMIAAFDYRRFIKDGDKKLLYIAHRESILKKSMLTFQAVLRDANFGTICGGGHEYRPSDHMFITVQTLASRGVQNLCDANYYDYIVVDEVHHGEAKTYKPIFEYFRPKILLGLTATPERSDGKQIIDEFGGRFAAEIRLPEAIDRELLVPFHYYGITDTADISNVSFVRGKLSASELEKIYTTGSESRNRADIVVKKVKQYMPDSSKIKGMGFCVSIKHAEFMNACFNEAGYRSKYIVSENSKECEQAIKDLKDGKIQFIFSVDMFNEGVDIPSVNLVLFLRPTDSMTIFIQQLGRGLRLSEGKTELTVLDFVGQADKRYKLYERKLDYLSSMSNYPLTKKIMNGFTGLPAGCSISLEEKAQEYILNNIEKSIRANTIQKKLEEFKITFNKIPSMQEFVDWLDIEPFDLYKGDTTFTGMCSMISGKGSKDENLEKQFSKGLRKLSLIDSQSWINAIEKMLSSTEKIENGNLHALMLYYTIRLDSEDGPGLSFLTLNDYIEYLRLSDYRDEILDVIEIRLNSIKFVEYDAGFDHPLRVNCSYTQDQILAAIGKSTFEHRHTLREGVLEHNGIDFFMITLNKSDKDYSISTMYNDYVMNERLFHWESQNKTSVTSSVGKRYLDESRKFKTLLFVREYKTYKGHTAPYTFIGRGSYKEHKGSKPIQIVWEMENDIPANIIECTTRV